MSELGQFYPDNLIGGDKKLVTESVTILSGQNLKRGAALGRVKVVVPTTGTAGTTNTGDGTVTAVTGGNKTQPGTYSIVCTRAVSNGGEFAVNGPKGYVGSVLITSGVGVFSSDEICFTITDGNVDFVVGDSFTVAVTAGVPATGTAGSGNTGNGTVTDVRGSRAHKVGTYTVECVEAATNGGKFEVKDPDGNSLGFTNACMYAGTGNGTITEIKQGRLKKPGRYTVLCIAAATNGGTFRVTDPEGVVLGDVSLPGTAGGSVRFIHEQISFLITDGSTDFSSDDVFRIDSFESDQIALVVNAGATDFVVGDVFTIAVTVGARDCKLVNSANRDGSGEVFGILAEDVDASVSSKVAVAYLEGQFVESQLIFGGDDTVETHRSQMRDVGIIAVDSVRASVNY